MQPNKRTNEEKELTKLGVAAIVIALAAAIILALGIKWVYG